MYYALGLRRIPDRKAGTRAETARNDITKLQFDWLFDARGRYFIMRGIKNVHRKVLYIIFTKIFHNLTITIHKHIDHI